MNRQTELEDSKLIEEVPSISRYPLLAVVTSEVFTPFLSLQRTE